MKTQINFVGLMTALILLFNSGAFATEVYLSEEAVEKTLAEKQFSPYVGRAYTSPIWYSPEQDR